MQKKHLICLFLFCVYTSCLYSQNSDTLVKTYGAFNFAQFKNLWNDTQNPASTFYQTYSQIGNASVNYGYQDNDFHSVFKAKSQNYFAVNTEGFTTKKGISYFGKFQYMNAQEQDLTWNNTSFISKDNPFILADSVGGNYDNEQFLLEGGISFPLGKSGNVWGLKAKYHVGSKANQSDPRPDIVSLRASVTMGVIVKRNLWDFGINLYLERLSEEIDVSIVDKVNHRYFRFMGFGQYQGVTDTYFERLYTGRNYGVALQASYNSGSLKNITELKIHREYERAEDGGGFTKYRAGDYKAYAINFSDKMFWFRDNYINKLSFNATYKNTKGIWFDQNMETGDDGTSYWHVYNESVKYKKNIFDLGLNYSLVKKKKDQASFKFSGNVNLNIALADFYPEKFHEDIYNLTVSLKNRKNWYKDKVDVSVSIGTEYRYNIKKDIYVQNIELQNIITYPEYYYRSSDYFLMDCELRLGLKKIFKTGIFPYVSLTGNGIFLTDKNSVYNDGDHRFFANLKVGFVF